MSLSRTFRLLSQAAAGTALEAVRQDAAFAIVVIHEFRTDRMDPAKQKANAWDYGRFAEAVFGVVADEVAHGQLYGPRRLPAGRHLHRPVVLYMGKAVCDYNA